MTRLCVGGLDISAQDTAGTKCYQTERYFWTKSTSFGKLMPLQPALLTLVWVFLHTCLAFGFVGLPNEALNETDQAL
jgi:hypothetical protein